MSNHRITTFALAIMLCSFPASLSAQTPAARPATCSGQEAAALSHLRAAIRQGKPIDKQATLSDAVTHGYRLLTRILIDLGANPLDPDSSGHTALELALQKNDIEMAKVIAGAISHPPSTASPSPAGPARHGAAVRPAMSPPLAEESSWWAARDEPPMLDTDLVPTDSQTVDGITLWTLREVRGVDMIFNGQEQKLLGDEAVVFLLVRDYVEYVTVNGQQQLRTTRKYYDWKQHPATRPAGTGTSPPIPFDHKNTATDKCDAPSLTVIFDPSGRSKEVTVSPGHARVTFTATNSDASKDILVWELDFAKGDWSNFDLYPQGGVRYFRAHGECRRIRQKGTSKNPGKPEDITDKKGVPWEVIYDAAQGYWQVGIGDVGRWRLNFPPILK